MKSDCYLLQIFIFEMLQQIGLWVRKFLSIEFDSNRTESKFLRPLLLKLSFSKHCLAWHKTNTTLCLL